MTNRYAGRAAILILALNCLSGIALENASVDVAATRAEFLKIVDRPRVPLAPQIEDSPEVNGNLEQHFTFASGPEQIVPGILLKPAKDAANRRPAVIVMHGTGGKKEGQIGLMKTLCAKGFVAVAIDGRFHGERAKTGTGLSEYYEAIHQAYKTGKEHPLYFDTVWDAMRLIDYLETRPDVDPARIGVIGFSKGGIETFLFAAVETRIAVAIPCIGVQSFHWGLDHDGWHGRLGTVQPAVNLIAKDEGTTVDAGFARKFFDKVIPGIYGQFDGPVMLQLITPRPLMVINGDSDDKTPLPGVLEAAHAAKAAYDAAHAEDKFVLRIEEKTGHNVNSESQAAAIEWFVKWLKP